MRWYEDMPNNGDKKENSNKFLVVFEDGTIYTFYKGNDDRSEKTKDGGKELRAKQELKLNWVNEKTEQKEVRMESRETIACWM